jgi:hypothetical protein
MRTKPVLGVYTPLHPFTFRLRKRYIHYFIFKSLSYQYVAHFKIFYKSYKTNKKYKRLHKCKRRALNETIKEIIKMVKLNDYILRMNIHLKNNTTIVFRI